MKKLLLLAASLVVGFSTTISAASPQPGVPGAEQVTRENVNQHIVNGAVIALQCKDTNGGLNKFFNGAAAKSQTLGYEQLYQVVTKGDGFVLKRLSNNKYVGKNGTTQTEVDEENSAAIFTAYGATLEGWTSKPDAITPATAPTIRFTTGDVHLNTREVNNTPNYANGRGGFSGWYVYHFAPKQVEYLKAAHDGTYQSTDLIEGLTGKNVLIDANPATTLTPGWYVIYNCGRQGYMKQEGAKLYMRDLATLDDNRMGAIADFAPYIFYVGAYPYTDYDDVANKIDIRSAYDNHFYFPQGSTTMTSFTTELECAHIGNSADHYYIKDIANDKIVDANAKGTTVNNTVVGYGNTIPTAANDASNNNWKFYRVYNIGDKLVDVTLTFVGINNENLPATATVKALTGTDITELIPGYLTNIPEFFTPTGVTETNTTISDSNFSFNVNGTWDYPFTLNKVFRADLRKSASNSCTKWTVKENGQISTRNNANVDQFQPENLFYLKGHGYDANNRLQVTLHTIAAEDSKGFACNNANNARVAISDAPTTWIVKTSTQATATDKGISLQHSDNANAHLNDMAELALWNNAANSQNDGGSFIRFFDLTDEDFTHETWHNRNDDLFYFIDTTNKAEAKTNPTSENVRALFSTARVASSATLTVQTKYNGRVIATTEFTDIVDTEVTVNAPAFFNDEPFTTTIPSANATVDYNVTQLQLPFAYTETTDNMLWQAVQIHTSYQTTGVVSDNEAVRGRKRFTWTYTEADSNTMVADEPANKATNGFADTQLWAFVGNIVDGFKIYNKEAGLNMWLYEEGTGSDQCVKVGTTEAGSIWKPGLSRTDSISAAYCCLSTNNVNYINLNVNANNAAFLTHWTDNDNGSTCWFTAAAEPLLATVADYVLEEYVGPANAVGAVDHNGIDFTGYAEYIAAAKANKYDLDAADKLRELIALYQPNVTRVALQPNGYYRIASINWADNYMYPDHSDNKFYGSHYSGQDYRSNYGTVFQFESVPDQANRYYLQSQGVYVGHVTGTDGNHHSGPVQATEVADRGEYSLVQENHDNVNACVTFAIKDLSQTDYNSLHQGSDAGSGKAAISAWREWAPGSHFYVLKAEDIEVALDQPHDGMNFGFGYFPFPVHATDADTKFYYVHESNNKKTGDAVITYTERDGATVPAHTPVMIGHKESASVVLAIGNAPEAANARRRAISAEGNNTIAEGTQETDTWTGTSWTNATADEVPEGIKALGVTVANVKYMARTITFADGGDLSVDFMYTSGSERVDICGVNLTDAEGTVVASDYHIGYSGTNKTDKVYSLKIPAAGTYTMRYYISNPDGRMDTNGNIFIDFTCKDKTPLLAGHLKATTAEAGDLVLGRDSEGNLAFVKTTEATAVKGNYVTLPAANLYDTKLAAATEIPLVNRNETTEIEELTAKQPAASNVVYDLQGRRLAAPVKGINIVNGKKVLVK